MEKVKSFERIKQGILKTFDWIYDRYEYFLVVPILLFALAGVLFGTSYLENGRFFQRSTEFTGGIQVTFSPESDINVDGLQSSFRKNFSDKIVVRSVGNKIRVEGGEKTTKDQIESSLDQFGVKYNDLQSYNASPVTKGYFFFQAQRAVIIAFIIISIVVFVAFRNTVPSIAVILAAVLDIVFAASMMILLGIELSFATIAALLILIGYSVDTDVLLTTKVIRRKKGKIKERMYSAMATGATMTVTGIVAFIVLYLVSTSPFLPSSFLLSQIALVILFGLIADLLSTWFQNAIILKMYLERK